VLHVRTLTRAASKSAPSPIVAALAALAACDASPPAPLFCPQPVTSALINGADVPASAIPAGAQAAIGALRKPNGQLVCTGTLIGDGWIVTARHCVDPATFDGLIFQTSRDLNALEATVAEYDVHPDLDVMLLRIPPSTALAALALPPVPLWDAADARDWVGATVTLAGFGDTADGSDGRRQFLDEPIVAAGATEIVVDGGPEHGACEGDSGGPLLAPSAAGDARVLGVLSGGSATCRGRDHYVASTGFAAWVAQVQAAAAQDPCGGLTAEGTCTHGVPRWCAGGAVQAAICTGDSLCGWNADEAGYRCVPSDQDPCRGAGPGGDCDGTTLRVCRRGVLAQADCAACGLICDLGPDGHAGCR
jgi:hypothetical protein